MKTILLILIIFPLYLILSTTSAFSDSSDCSSIKDSDERLKCYDKESTEFKVTIDMIINWANSSNGEQICSLNRSPDECLGLSVGEAICMVKYKSREFVRNCQGADIGEGLCMSGSEKRDLIRNCQGANIKEGLCMAGGGNRDLIKDCQGASKGEALCMFGNENRSLIPDCQGANIGEGMCMARDKNKTLEDCLGAN